MKIFEKNPPRSFVVGLGDPPIEIKDCGEIALLPDEQVTFTTESGAEYDLARKSWGFYATPSLNSRLQRFNLRAILVRNRLNHFFVVLVEGGREEDFHRYLESESLTVVCWMDTTQSLKALEQRVGDTSDE